ncbi:MAG: type II secretion system protein [Christensenellales bacterium]|jgi:prepilin-type N-terminal cleavage/methylation domain-containing protein
MNVFYKRRKANQKGFTLIELIVVIAILVILAAVAIPAFSGLQAEARRGVVTANASEIANAVNIHNASNPNDKVADGTTEAALKTKLGTLAPTIDESDTKIAEESWKSVDITDGIATVDNEHIAAIEF